MSRVNSFFILLTFLLLILVQGCEKGGTVTGSSGDSGDDSFATIRGRVIQIDSTGSPDIFTRSQPVNEVQLKIFDSHGAVLSTSVTDSAGNFELQWVKRGITTLLATRDSMSAMLSEFSVDSSGTIDAGELILMAPGMVSGRIRLPDTDDYSMSRITVFPLKREYRTNSLGEFLFSGLPQGAHRLSIEKYGYGTVSIDFKVTSGQQTVIPEILLYPDTENVIPSVFSGSVKGVAKMSAANSPYLISGDITVVKDALLIIEPGVTVKFACRSDSMSTGVFNGGLVTKIRNHNTLLSELIVEGAVFAAGNVEAPVIFTSDSPNPSSGDWGGIYFSSGSRDALCLLRHCRVMWSDMGCLMENSSPTLEGCVITDARSHGIGILGRSANPKIYNSMITSSTNALAVKQGGGTIRSSILSRSMDEAVVIEDSQSFKIDDCIISSNPAGGIRVSRGRGVEIRSSIIGENLFGILDDDSFNLYIQNSVIISNTTYGVDMSLATLLRNNDVYGNQSPGNGSGASGAGNYVDGNAGTGDLHVNPKFLKPDYLFPDRGDWNIDSTSPLVNAGYGKTTIGLENPASIGP
ncbi:MAG: hypothetical protein CVV64_04015 [Candidatus Wallbacteria bacterium HGW-Wallbacteria-1]|jgi:hypothetical protein|uniref:Right handed beta helix domain-containing protein n=1 Tax=Candidatus Wallbacteria bacterium HGW-Wallbacteria-1 TaxID=2013854 RepID=A0A2N1PRH3_9BACT|nr:MAG: hypothetical protein CVV64_04015 [Candidatus Wallbacteria bacterium HGW-Wallbacteria-1]